MSMTNFVFFVSCTLILVLLVALMYARSQSDRTQILKYLIVAVILNIALFALVLSEYNSKDAHIDHEDKIELPKNT